MTRFTLFLVVFLLTTTTFGETAATTTDEVESLVTAMAKVGFASSPSFSPDGSEIAFLTNISGLPQIWTISTRGGYPRMVTALDDPVSVPLWSPDGKWIAFSSAPGGGLNSQIFVIRPDGTGMRRLTEGGKTNNWIGPWRSDGSAIGLASSRRTPDALDTYLVSTAGEFRLVAKNEGIATVDSISRDGQWVLVNRLRSRGSNDLYLVDANNGQEILLTPHAGPGEFFGAVSPDGRAVLLASNKDRDLAAFGRVSLAGGQAAAIEILAERTDAELESVELDRSGQRVALLWNRAGENELALYDLAAQRETVVRQLPAELVGDLTFSPDGSLLAFSASGATQPRDIYVLDVASQESRRLTFSPHAGVDLARLVRPAFVRYPSHDGLELSGWLYRAPGEGSGPVVMSFHGGPEGQERPAFNSTYQALVARGISVFAPNVRGSSGFGKKFVNLDNGALRVDAVRDIKATIDYLVRSGIADARRIGIMGGSYGGYMVMAGLAEYPTEIAAGANLFGVVNFETFFRHSEPWMAAISTVEYGDPHTEAEMLRRLSPLSKIDRVVSPTIVLHGANDTNVPVVEAEQVVANLRQRQVPVEYVLFADEGHGWRKTPNRIKSTVSIVAWFTKYLRKP
jgi:dipeptidyl aminopeptidase/acylaminoacyl peptidase